LLAARVTTTLQTFLFGMELVKQGIRWGIGDGLHTQILSDNWISDFTPDRVKIIGMSLIDADSRSWDSKWSKVFLRMISHPKFFTSLYEGMEVNIFLTGPMPSSMSTRSNQPTIWCDLRILCHGTSLSKRGLPMDSIVKENLWKKLWSIKAPGKTKIVLWILEHDCLPSGSQLRRCNIPTSNACLFCNRQESVIHTIVFCPYATEVWRAVKAVYHVHLVRKHFSTPKS
jgi:hypothetical protein